MSDQEQVTEADNVSLGAQAAAGGDGELAITVNLAPKTQEFGEGGDVSSAAESSLNESLMMKSEVDDDISVKGGNNRRNKSMSPAKGSSKRKRKNRRRREKKAGQATSGNESLDGVSLTSGGEDGTGTENEMSINEDVKKADETGTESETTFHSCPDAEGDQTVSSVCVEPSTTITSIPEEDLELDESVPEESASLDQEAPEKVNDGPTHSVDKLLQIAKCKILSQTLEPLQESIDNEANDTTSTNLVVPPCSPSSLQSVNNSTETGISNDSAEVQKPATKNVHFDEGPPEIVSLEAAPSEELVFELYLNSGEAKQENTEVRKKSSKETLVLVGNIGHTDSTTSSLGSESSAASVLKAPGSSYDDFAETNSHMATVDETPDEQNVHFDEGPPEVVAFEAAPSEEIVFELNLNAGGGKQENAATSKKPSKETLVLVGNIGHTDSATSSLGSESSAGSMLKATGSSCEDFAETNHHFPSRETVDETLDDQNGREQGSGIHTDPFREAIQSFKIHNPLEARYIGNEVDSILTKSMDKVSTLMERTASGNDNTVPVLVSSNEMSPDSTTSENTVPGTANEARDATMRNVVDQQPEQNERNLEEDDKDDQGCACGKVCVIT